ELVANFSNLLTRTLGETIELRTMVTGAGNLALVDVSQLQNTLLNLALNARDAMPGGGRLTVEISTTVLDRDYALMYPEVRMGRYVLITVTDTGTGMTEEIKRHAFEPFFTTKGTGSGTGLGLSMVYGFVMQSRGHVQLYSEQGRGTSVRIFLPAARGEEQPAGTATGDDAALDAVSRGHETILVVEDDPRVRRVVVARLEDAGYNVIEAEAGAQALDLLSAHPEIALVFTDVIMPGGMTGGELAQHVRALRPEVKMLFTSGYAEPSVVGKELKDAGSWLQKPYTAKELARRLRDLLD
ncbi:MAG TPA: ATP-binding protein, partial [Sinorhizobium sp.]|nr:ATP-binding protein [Sinorhizobium sp.]